jgi:hypothetical protein
MITPAKRKTWCAAATACAFLLQSCATMTRGTSQEIPVTSHPAGARVIVDGHDLGVTPMGVKLARKKEHLVRIEKEGYVPLEIKAESNVSGGGGAFFLGNLLWGLLGMIPGSLMTTTGAVATVATFGTQGKEKVQSGKELMLVGFLLGFVAALTVDAATGAHKTLQPEELKVTLEKAGEGTRSGVTVLTIKGWQSVKWIRIACAGSNAPADTLHLK